MILLINSNSIRIPLASESVHCVVTSPPYWGLRDYGLPPLIWGGEAGCRHVWGNEVIKHRSSGGPQVPQTKWSNCESVVAAQRDTSSQFCQLCNAWLGCLGLEPTVGLYVQHLVMVFREVWRVLRRDGTVWLNLGSSYASSTKGDNRTREQKLSSSGLNLHKNLHKAQSQMDLAGSRKVDCGNFKPKDLIPIPWLVALALQADGWWLRSDIIWHKPNCMPESVQDRPTMSHEYVFLLAKSKRYFYDGDAIRVGHKRLWNESNIGSDNMSVTGIAEGIILGRKEKPHCGIANTMPNPAGRNRRTVWTIPTSPYKGAHFATFPPALVEPCIKAGTSERGVCPECGAQWERVTERGAFHPTGGSKGNARGSGNPQFTSGMTPGYCEYHTTGWQPTCACDTDHVIPATVLDPFVGSGTTCLVSRQLGRRSIGLDLSFAYLRDQARTRLELDKLTAWENGKQVEANWEELPLFQAS